MHRTRTHTQPLLSSLPLPDHRSILLPSFFLFTGHIWFCLKSNISILARPYFFKKKNYIINKTYYKNKYRFHALVIYFCVGLFVLATQTNRHRSPVNIL